MEPNDEKKTVDKKEDSNNAGAALIALGIFAYNSYVIFHNLQVHDGYLWVVGGIVVNLGIAIALLRDWGSPLRHRQEFSLDSRFHRCQRHRLHVWRWQS